MLTDPPEWTEAFTPPPAAQPVTRPYTVYDSATGAVMATFARAEDAAYCARSRCGWRWCRGGPPGVQT